MVGCSEFSAAVVQQDLRTKDKCKIDPAKEQKIKLLTRSLPRVELDKTIQHGILPVSCIPCSLVIYSARRFTGIRLIRLQHNVAITANMTEIYRLCLCEEYKDNLAWLVLGGRKTALKTTKLGSET